MCVCVCECVCVCASLPGLSLWNVSAEQPQAEAGKKQSGGGGRSTGLTGQILSSCGCAPMLRHFFVLWEVVVSVWCDAEREGECVSVYV